MLRVVSRRKLGEAGSYSRRVARETKKGRERTTSSSLLRQNCNSSSPSLSLLLVFLSSFFAFLHGAVQHWWRHFLHLGSSAIRSAQTAVAWYMHAWASVPARHFALLQFVPREKESESASGERRTGDLESRTSTEGET